MYSYASTRPIVNLVDDVQNGVFGVWSFPTRSRFGNGNPAVTSNIHVILIIPEGNTAFAIACVTVNLGPEEAVFDRGNIHTYIMVGL